MMIYARFADKSLVKAIERRNAFTLRAQQADRHVTLAQQLLSLFKPSHLAHHHG